jgi:hypothetical protein
VDVTQTTDLCFAPAGRATDAVLSRSAAVIQSIALLREALDAMPHMVMVLNEHRQIVAANKAFETMLNRTVEEVRGQRPGEAFGCIRAGDGVDGCGTGRHCAVCGAVHTVLESQRAGEKVQRECRILVTGHDGPLPMDLRVTATPFSIEDDALTLVSIEDISREKRLAVLERTFFHDLANTAGCIQGFIQCLERGDGVNPGHLQKLGSLADDLVEEIRAHREITSAESGDLVAEPTPLVAGQFLQELLVRWQRHAAAEKRNIELQRPWDGMIVTDRHLLARVLGNMIKNALEATAPGNTVTIVCDSRDDRVEFTVHNVETMPEEVQLQVFQRSFSTKAAHGRGLGTHSMRLLGERYLKGRIDFVSTPEEGTAFRFRIPKRI